MAFFEPVLHAWANIIDSHFTNKIFQRIEPLILLSEIFGLCILPIIFFIDPPHFVTTKLAIIIFVISLIEILYLYPYYYSLRHADTSVVAALFSLGKLFIPLFAFLLVHEKLFLHQYVGFLILVLSGIILSVNFKKMSLNKAFFAMLGVSVLLALQSVLLKFIYQAGVSWGSSIFWMTLFQFFIALCLFLNPKNSAGLFFSIKQIKSVGRLFLLMEFLSWVGTLGSYYVLYLIPVSIAKGISSTQPIFVLLYALIFARFFPNIFKEYLGKDGVIKKIILFILTIIGVWLIA